MAATRTGVRWALVATVAVLLGACSGSSAGDGTTTTTTADEGPPTTLDPTVADLTLEDYEAAVALCFAGLDADEAEEQLSDAVLRTCGVLL